MVPRSVLCVVTARSYVNRMSMDDTMEALSIHKCMMGRLVKMRMRWTRHVGKNE